MTLDLKRWLSIGLPILVLSVSACGETVAGPGLGPEPPEQVDPVQAALDSFLIANPDVLSAIGLFQSASGQLSRGASGFLDNSRTTAVEPGTKFKIGSTTKAFTATIILQLIEEDRVNLDEPVVGYVSPEWAGILDAVTYGSEITVRHALSHRSGIYDYLASPLQSALLSEPGRIYTPFEAFRFVLSGPAHFRPGTDFHYSNTNFLLLGHIIESLTGQPYAEALEERILSRVGLENTFMYFGADESQRDGIAHSYETIGGVRFDNLDLSSSGWAWAAGGLISTTGDLVKFLHALGSGRLFTDTATLAAMTHLGDNTWYGLGVQIDEYPGVGWCFGHGGYAFGSTAHVRHCPDAGVTFSAFYAGENSTKGAQLDIVERILRAVS